jgi:hypothetical protein
VVGNGCGGQRWSRREEIRLAALPVRPWTPWSELTSLIFHGNLRGFFSCTHTIEAI